MTHSAQDINFLRHLQQPKWQRVALIWIKGVGWSLVSLMVVLGVILSLVHWSIAKRSVALTQEYEQKKSLLAEEEQEKVKQRGDFLGELPKSFKLSRQGFYPLMHQLSMQPHPDVWLAQFGYSYPGGSVEFIGFSTSTHAVQDFIAQLSFVDLLKGTYFPAVILSMLDEDSSGQVGDQRIGGTRKRVGTADLTFKKYIKVGDEIVEQDWIGSALKVRTYKKGTKAYNDLISKGEVNLFSYDFSNLEGSMLSKGAKYVFNLRNNM